MTLQQATFSPCHGSIRNHRWFYLFLYLTVTSSLVKQTNAWDSEELEIFDLVEEVNTNFYTLLGIPEDADNKEIKKAFRRLSLLVAVYEVLSDENKRKCYNEVLVNGLPDWKHAVYYYRRVRKMGLLEMAVILFPLVTVGQYIVLWAAYAEKKYTAEQYFSSKMKKIQKKQKKGKTEGADSAQELLIDLPKPSVYDLLPFQTVRLLWLAVTGAPQCYQMLQALLAERRRQQQEEAEETSEESAQEEDPEEKRERRARRRKAFLPPELGPEDDNCLLDPAEEPDSEIPAPPPRKLIVGGLWTDDDLTELAKLVKKFPGGTPERWEKIADSMNRSVPEVTHMARKIKEENYRPAPIPSEETPVVEFKPSKIKTKGGKFGRTQPEDGTEREVQDGEEPQPSVQDVWSYPQQKALENALTKYPKGSSERWANIAKCVPGKSLEECITRYKTLVERVKKKKEQQQTPTPINPEPSAS
ncbi:hypothetical protein B566_EDAN002173 [Ephemera danica]|nr:hypothetical protein B566_EDAN002173 [Ephemera danica]